jgi:hypothetical protein
MLSGKTSTSWFTLGMFPCAHNLHRKLIVFFRFGFLLVFTGRHSWSSVALNFFLSAFSWLWSILCYGFWHKVAEGDFSHPIKLTVVKYDTFQPLDTPFLGSRKLILSSFAF